MYVYVCIWICTCICIYVYDSICWALKRPVHCAEQLLELKICISPQFRAIDPPNPARGFIQLNENVRLATAACVQKYGNVSFVTVACAKCMRYGGGGWGTIPLGGGVGIRDPDSYIHVQYILQNSIYVIINYAIYIYIVCLKIVGPISIGFLPMPRHPLISAKTVNPLLR